MSSTYFKSVNPATGKLIARHPPLDDAGIEAMLAAAATRAGHWAQASLAERCALLERLAGQLESVRDRLADLMMLEMSKLRREALAEVDKCAWVCRYYAEQAPRMLADKLVETDAARSLVVIQPLGVVLAIMPWNFPLWQVFRAAAPALAAGNVLLLKHASNVIGCGNAITRLFEDAGTPPGLFGHLAVGAARIADVIADPRVHAVTLTGSEAAGRAVAAAAGQALKKTVLELGGSDPFIVLEDADLDHTVEKAVLSRYMNCGQSCIAAKRFIVVDAIADDFVRRFVQGVEALRLGAPDDPVT